MDKEVLSGENDSIDITVDRDEQRKKLSTLGDYEHGYTVESFLKDLMVYFDNEVDFNLSKIKAIIERPGKVEWLIEKAKKSNTHPVSEFVQEMLRESAEEA